MEEDDDSNNSAPSTPLDDVVSKSQRRVSYIQFYNLVWLKKHFILAW